MQVWYLNENRFCFIQCASWSWTSHICLELFLRRQHCLDSERVWHISKAQKPCPHVMLCSSIIILVKAIFRLYEARHLWRHWRPRAGAQKSDVRRKAPMLSVRGWPSKFQLNLWAENSPPRQRGWADRTFLAMRFGCKLYAFEWEPPH